MVNSFEWITNQPNSCLAKTNTFHFLPPRYLTWSSLVNENGIDQSPLSEMELDPRKIHNWQIQKSFKPNLSLLCLMFVFYMNWLGIIHLILLSLESVYSFLLLISFRCFSYSFKSLISHSWNNPMRCSLKNFMHTPPIYSSRIARRLFHFDWWASVIILLFILVTCLLFEKAVVFTYCKSKAFWFAFFGILIPRVWDEADSWYATGR